MPQQPGTEESKKLAQERILRTAESIFGSSGFAGTKMNDIAREAGVNQALIHYYFQSKENLYREVIHRLLDKWQVYVRSLSWDDDDPETVLRKYIRVHFEFQCDYPNLYRMFQREALEGKSLFQEHVFETWTLDMIDKMKVIRKWQRNGVVNARVKPKMFLHMLWGTMHQFYYRSLNELGELLEQDGEIGELRERVVDQIAEMVLEGFLPTEDSEERAVALAGVSPERKPPLPVRILDGGEGDLPDEAGELLDYLGSYDRIVLERSEWELSENDSLPPASLLIVCTVYGEIPEWTLKFLNFLDSMASKEDFVIGIWVVNDRPAARDVQRMLEDAVHRAQGFAVARPDGDSPGLYARRFIKLTKALTH